MGESIFWLSLAVLCSGALAWLFVREWQLSHPEREDYSHVDHALRKEARRQHGADRTDAIILRSPYTTPQAKAWAERRLKRREPRLYRKPREATTP